jgi:Tfp pilus assembly protein PilF
MPTRPKSEAPAARFSLGLGHLIFLGVFALRLWVLLRLTHSALLLPSRGDMYFYDNWARKILGGELTQPRAFYGLPGYAYFLAIIYKFFGPNPFVPAFLQAAVDAGIAGVIYRLADRTLAGIRSTECMLQPWSPATRKIIASLAALGWALFVPAQAYSVVLMPTVWFIFVFWFVVLRVVRGSNPPTAMGCFFLALLIGLTATAVATVLAIVPLLVGALWIKSSESGRHWRLLASKMGLILAGLALGTAPCWVHNYFVARDPVFLSAHSGINLWIGNNPEANGYPRFPPGLRAGQAAMLQDSIDQAEAASGRPLTHAEVSAYWSARARNYIANHSGDWLKLLGRKARNFWSAFQYDDLSIITNLREQAVTLPGLYFGVVAAFAIPGLLFACWLAPQSRWIVVAVALSMLILLPVFITERYRLVAVPGLVILAVFGLSVMWQACLANRFRVVSIYLFCLVASATAVAWPQDDPALWALDAYNSGWQALESGNFPLAEKKLAIAFGYVPDNPETLFALGNLRLAENESDVAGKFYLNVIKVDPQHKGALNNLGVVALQANRYDEAELWFRRTADVDPRNAKTHFLLAKTMLAKNDLKAARVEINTAIGLNPDQVQFKELKREIDQSSR